MRHHFIETHIPEIEVVPHSDDMPVGRQNSARSQNQELMDGSENQSHSRSAWVPERPREVSRDSCQAGLTLQLVEMGLASREASPKSRAYAESMTWERACAARFSL